MGEEGWGPSQRPPCGLEGRPGGRAVEGTHHTWREDGAARQRRPTSRDAPGRGFDERWVRSPSTGYLSLVRDGSARRQHKLSALLGAAGRDVSPSCWCGHKTRTSTGETGGQTRRRRGPRRGRWPRDAAEKRSDRSDETETAIWGGCWRGRQVGPLLTRSLLALTDFDSTSYFGQSLGTSERGETRRETAAEAPHAQLRGPVGTLSPGQEGRSPRRVHSKVTLPPRRQLPEDVGPGRLVPVPEAVPLGWKPAGWRGLHGAAGEAPGGTSQEREPVRRADKVGRCLFPPRGTTWSAGHLPPPCPAPDAPWIPVRTGCSEDRVLPPTRGEGGREVQGSWGERGAVPTPAPRRGLRRPKRPCGQ